MSSPRHFVQPLDLNRIRVSHSPRLPVINMSLAAAGRSDVRGDADETAAMRTSQTNDSKDTCPMRATLATAGAAVDSRNGRVDYYRQMLRSRTHPKEGMHADKQPDSTNQPPPPLQSATKLGISEPVSRKAHHLTPPSDLPTVSSISSTASSSMSSQSLASPENLSDLDARTSDGIDRLGDSLESTCTVYGDRNVVAPHDGSTTALDGPHVSADEVALQRQLTGGDSSGTREGDSSRPGGFTSDAAATPSPSLSQSSPCSTSSVRVVCKTVHWEIPIYRGADGGSQETTFDSEPFYYLGQAWRFSFVTHSEYSHGIYLALLSTTRSPPAMQLGCEFRIHCLLKPTYSLRASADYFFGRDRPKVHGFDHFIGPRLAAYVNNEGCVLMSGVLTSSPEDIIQ